MHVLSDNNHGDFAPRAAERFCRILGQELKPSPSPQAKVAPPAARPPKISPSTTAPAGPGAADAL